MASKKDMPVSTDIGELRHEYPDWEDIMVQTVNWARQVNLAALDPMPENALLSKVKGRRKARQIKRQVKKRRSHQGRKMAMARARKRHGQRRRQNRIVGPVCRVR